MLHGGAWRNRPGGHRSLYAHVVTHHPPDRDRHSRNRCDPQAWKGFPEPSQKDKGKPQGYALSTGVIPHSTRLHHSDILRQGRSHLRPSSPLKLTPQIPRLGGCTNTRLEEP